jgi:hypothetical protein
MCGVDLTRIDGIDVTTALVVVSAIGTDMGKLPSDKHFASWLGLCPGTRITGGKVMSSKPKPCANRAAQAPRLAAAALRASQSALGAYHRRLCARMDKAKAVTAAAHKLARLIDTMRKEFLERPRSKQDTIAWRLVRTRFPPCLCTMPPSRIDRWKTLGVIPCRLPKLRVPVQLRNQLR